MTQAQAREIAESLEKRHAVLYGSQKWLVVNVSRALAPSLPVAGLCLSRDMNAPLRVGGVSVSYRKVHVWPEGF